VPDTLDAQILRDAEPFFERSEKMQLEYDVQNTMRAIGTRSSSAITRKFGMHALPEGRLHIRLEGSAGQSLGAFSVQGLLLEVIGDANDYVGKGLSGATIVVAPRPKDRRSASGDAIIGNTCLYGATSGKLFASGTAGVRFAVRNSGAKTVVEGCGANGCEYMTNGRAVILGPVGDNFGAGMTGGAAFIWDPTNRFERVANPDSIDWYPLPEVPTEHIGEAKALIEEHVRRTGSVRGKEILDDWDRAVHDMLMVVPKEIAHLLLGRTKPKAKKKVAAKA
jgi:glutamate synthase (NADPH/NADH) large chain